MNSIEHYILNQHYKEIDDRWQKFSIEAAKYQNSDTFSILYATDIHYIRSYAKYLMAYEKVKEMVEFSKYTGFDLLAIAGDLVDGNTMIENQYRDLHDLIGLIKQSKTTSVAICKGNHDDCSWYAFKNKLGKDAWLSQKDWYAHVINPIRVQYPICVDMVNPEGGYYYIDYPFHKIRVINLNTSDNTTIADRNGIISEKSNCGQWNFGISQKQLKWLSKALTFDEEGWAVIILSHKFLLENDYSKAFVHNGREAWRLLTAFKNRDSGVIKGRDKFFECEIEYDFSRNKSCDMLPYLYGHTHREEILNIDGISAVSASNILKSTGEQLCDENVEIIGGWDCIFVDRKRRSFISKRFNVPNMKKEIIY